MRILVLNWRDIRSSRGGGAERVTHEIAKRLVARGHEVTWLSSSEQGLEADETVEGVRIVRRGSEVTTRLHAASVARRCAPDVVLEEINTLPYLAPIWSKAPVLLYMNQLAREVWWYEAPLPIAMVGFVSEPLYLKAYRKCDAVTISLSSVEDLRVVGIRGVISIAPMAADVERLTEPFDKPRVGGLVAVGRLTPSKRYGHAIQALGVLRKRYPSATLTLIGEGRARAELERCAARLDLSSAVRFVGRVDESLKIELLTRADVLVGTSVREGWGLTVTEAAARGTPSVVYDIPGFRDSVIDGRTGLLVAPNPHALARGVARLLDDSELYDRVRAEAWRTAPTQGFEAATNAFEQALQRAASAS